MESFIILILFCILPIILNSATIKGWFGEKTISLILNNLPKSNYKIINNVMLRTKKRN